MPHGPSSWLAASHHRPEQLVLLGVLMAHALALGLWLQHRPAETPTITLMSVRLLSPAPVAPSVQPRAQPAPPRPQPPVKPLPPVTRVQAPAPAAAPVEPPKPVPDAVKPAPAPEPVAAATPVAAPATPEEATLPPRFDADYLDNPSPRYPPLSRKLAEQGRVLLRVMVTASGRAQRVQIERSSGYSRLDDAAVEAVTDWRFVPARQGSQAVAAQVLVPIVFSLTR